LKHESSGCPDTIGARKPRVGIVCDLLEERWHSMDLVADMLLTNLRESFSCDATAVRLRPKFVNRFTAITRMDGSKLARNADRLLNRFWYFPRYLVARAHRFDVFHVVDHTYAHLVHWLPASLVIVTCHDLDAIRCVIDPASAPRSMPFRALARRILTGMQKAALVTCVSDATRDELVNRGVVSADHAIVVRNGVEPVFNPQPDATADRQAAAFLGDPRDGLVNILHVGSTIPRKRIDVLLHSFALARMEQPGLRLIRVGGPFDRPQSELVRRLNLDESVIVLPFIDRRTLAGVYRRATMLVLPSDGEGFGLPVVEAMACGTPVIAADLPALREAGGDAALYCAPGDISRWADAMLAMAIDDPAGREAFANRRRLGLEQAAKFSWKRSAATMVGLYRRVVFPQPASVG
jgi:glycosyltransferase involved in cell wall biosynthesis